MRSLASLLAGVLLTAGVLSVQAQSNQDWTNWRGPNYDGSSPARNLPVEFSPNKNVRWATALPGPSAATPVVLKDRIYLSSVDTANNALLALCVDRKSGKILWQHKAGSGFKPAGLGSETSLDYRSNYASPSPVSDGERVVFFYGNGDLVTYDLDGKLLWRRNLQKEYGEFCFGWTFSSSPLLFDGKLYCQILQRNLAVQGRGRDGEPSFLLALEPATGKELWKVERPSPAKMESREAFTTPVPVKHDGKWEIVLAGGDLLSGHDPKTGKELWRWGTWNVGHNHPTLRLVPSPVAGGGVVLGCAPKAYPVFAVKLGMTGDISSTGSAWRSEERSAVTSDVPTPLFYQGKFFVLSDLRKAISAVDSAGKTLWTTAIPSRAMCWASPTGADGKIYVMSLLGEVFVVSAEDGKILATNPMAQEQNEIRSSVVAAYDSLYIRTNTHLYCVAADAQQ